MKNKWRVQGLIGLCVAGLILAGPFVWRLAALPSANDAALLTIHPAQQAAGDLNGEYSGQVTLEGVFNDVYSSTTPIITSMDLGEIDLALLLTQADNAVTGYISLDNTWVKTQVQTIQVTPVGPPPEAETPAPAPVDLAVGPQVNGTFDGTNLSLQSQPFTGLLNGRTLTRQFRLEGVAIQNGDIISGTYRETLWGFASQPSTVVGAFSLARPVYYTPTPGAVELPIPVTPVPPPDESDFSLYLPLIQH